MSSGRFFNLLFVSFLALASCIKDEEDYGALIISTGYNLVDDIERMDIRRVKRYVLNRRWNRNVLTWTLQKENINPADSFIIRNTLHRAFVVWAEVSSLRFIELPVESKIPADINVSFLKGRHGDQLPFDGAQGVVAHAYFPPTGVLHFDADEDWTLSRSDGINLYQTAVHEIGHILGLGHSNDKRATMFPQNKQFDRDYELSDDDVRGIRRLYPPSKHQLPIKLSGDHFV